MKTSSLKITDGDRRHRGYGIFRDRLDDTDVEWLRTNIPEPGAWFYGYDEGVVNRVLYFRHEEDRALFLIACGS